MTAREREEVVGEEHEETNFDLTVSPSILYVVYKH